MEHFQELCTNVVGGVAAKVISTGFRKLIMMSPQSQLPNMTYITCIWEVQRTF